MKGIELMTEHHRREEEGRVDPRSEPEPDMFTEDGYEGDEMLAVVRCSRSLLQHLAAESKKVGVTRSPSPGSRSNVHPASTASCCKLHPPSDS